MAPRLPWGLHRLLRPSLSSPGPLSHTAPATRLSICPAPQLWGPLPRPALPSLEPWAPAPRPALPTSSAPSSDTPPSEPPAHSWPAHTVVQPGRGPVPRHWTRSWRPLGSSQSASTPQNSHRAHLSAGWEQGHEQGSETGRGPGPRVCLEPRGQLWSLGRSVWRFLTKGGLVRCRLPPGRPPGLLSPTPLRPTRPLSDLLQGHLEVAGGRCRVGRAAQASRPGGHLLPREQQTQEPRSRGAHDHSCCPAPSRPRPVVPRPTPRGPGTGFHLPEVLPGVSPLAPRELCCAR